MSKTVDAGIVTAYGAAVRGGYEGKYAQFCADLGKLADVLSEFMNFDVTVQTLAEGASATASYDDGVLALGIPRGNTGNGIQSIVLNADYTLTVTYTNGNTWTSGSIRGQVGATPHLTIGTVQTLEPGQSATASITGTDEDPVLNLGIPKGQAGASDAGGVSYDPESSYNDGTVGAELQEQNRQLNDETTGLDTKAPVILETASGAIASFSDGADNMPVKKLVAQIEPVQDLHGYDHPWPAGGGKNLLSIPAFDYGPILSGVTWSIANGSELTASGTATNNSVPYTASHSQSYENAHCGPYPAGTYTFNASGYPSVAGGTRLTIAVFKQDGTKIKDGIFVTDNYNTTITSDQPFKIGFWCTVIKGDTVDFTAKLMLTSANDTSYAPYSNICPISGWTGLSGKRTGKNVLEIKRANATTNGVTFTKQFDADGNCIGVLANGTATAFTVFDFNVVGSAIQPTDLVDGQSYVFTGLPSSGSASTYGLRIANDQGQPIDGRITDVNGRTFTKSSDMVIFGFVMSTGTTVTDLLIQPMIRPASNTDSTFEPYTGDTISVNWQEQAGTVYGGYVDVVSGHMTLTHKTFEIDGVTTGKKATFSSSWNTDETHQNCVFGYGNNGYDAKYAYGSSEIVDCISDIFTPTSYNGVASISAVPKYGVFALIDATPTQSSKIRTCIPKSLGITTVDQMNDWIFSNGGFTIVYRLLNPVTYQLTPQEVTTLLKYNRVWTDVGPVSVEYPADTGKVVDELNRHLNDVEDDKQDKTTYVTLTGTIITQTGADNTMYLCGELAELTFTAPATGQTAIRFTSGTTPTVATFNGVTWLNGFSPLALEANKLYEINVLNGVGVAAWT